MTTGPAAHAWGLAVDFGTTATAAVTVTGEHVSLLSLDGGGRMSSSVYATGSDSELLVGRQADNEAAYALDRYEPTPKRKIHRQTVRLGGRQFTPVELIAAVMAQVLSDAVVQHNGSPPAWLVVTHPVAWPPSQRQVLAGAMEAAANRLGVWIPEPQFVSEPVAAAQWYSRDTYHDPPRVGQKVAVYDLGGGTFDVAVLERTDNGFAVIHSGGIDPLGGYDFDHRLFTYLGNKYIAQEAADVWRGLQRPEPGDVEMGERRRNMQVTVQLLKEALSTQTSRQTQLRGVPRPVLVTRPEFETLIVADVDRTIEELLTTLDECDLTVGDLAWIYRVGGASRIPLVGQKLQALGAPVHVYDDPKLVVALGASATPNLRSDIPPPPPRPVPDPPPEPVVRVEEEHVKKVVEEPVIDNVQEAAPTAAVRLGRLGWRSVVAGTTLLAFAVGACVLSWVSGDLQIASLVVIAGVSAIIGALLIRIGALQDNSVGRGYTLVGVTIVAAAVAAVSFRLYWIWSADLSDAEYTAMLDLVVAVLGGLAFAGTLLVVAPQFRRTPGRAAATGLVVGGMLIALAEAASLFGAEARYGWVEFLTIDAIPFVAAAVLIVSGFLVGRRRNRLRAQSTG